MLYFEFYLPYNTENESKYVTKELATETNNKPQITKILPNIAIGL